jgi:bifunctional DNase/RNase
MGAELLEINIVDVREAIFFANLKFQLDGKVVEVDSRPSDAIALSVRFGAPIFVSDKVIQEAGIEMQENTPELSAAPPEPEALPPVKTKGEILIELRNKMSEAIQNEDYEKAAALRDEIQKLENS